MASYNSVPLFGGAVTANIPNDYADISDIRDVPSNQEIWLHTTGLTSIIFEILEYAAPPEHPCETDEEALKYHYADMVSAGYTSKPDDEEVTQFWNAGDVVIPSLSVQEGDAQSVKEGKKDARVLGILGTQTPQRVDEKQKTQFTALLTTLVRLPAKETDVLITVSVPHNKGEYDASAMDMEKGTWGPLIERGMEIRKEVWKTFEIVDWGLFDG